MRFKAEILDDALRAIDKPITGVRGQVKLTLLTLEALVDIRDELHELNQSVGSNLIDHARES